MTRVFEVGKTGRHLVGAPVELTRKTQATQSARASAEGRADHLRTMREPDGVNAGLSARANHLLARIGPREGGRHLLARIGVGPVRAGHLLAEAVNLTGSGGRFTARLRTWRLSENPTLTGGVAEPERQAGY